MDTNLILFNQNELQRVIGTDGQVENFNISQTEEGYKKLELQIYYPTGHRKFFILKEKRSIIERREICINPFNNKAARDQEIRRLYKEEKMTQIFIAKIFGLKQPTISTIINN